MKLEEKLIQIFIPILRHIKSFRGMTVTQVAKYPRAAPMRR
jgi:hypothetical protein